MAEFPTDVLLPADQTEFAAMVFRGQRFASHSMPLSVLRELETYQRLVIDVARALFMKRHPERRRLPNGFESRLRLSLRAVEAGSAKPVLLRESNGHPHQTEIAVEDEFAEARDVIAATIKAANDNAVIPDQFPVDLLSSFDQFGKTLQAGESIELRSLKDTPGPVYSNVTRRSLVLLKAETYTEDVRLVGAVTALQVADGAFEIEVDGRRIKSPCGPDSIQLLLKALNPENRARVCVWGTARFDRQDKVIAFESAEEITYYGPNELSVVDLDVRLAELKKLEIGWFDGAGEPIAGVLLQVANVVFEHLHANHDVPIPYLYPNPEGLLRAEWSIGPWEISADIASTSGFATHLDFLNVETDEGSEHDLGLIQEMTTIAELIRSVMGAEQSTGQVDQADV